MSAVIETTGPPRPATVLRAAGVRASQGGRQVLHGIDLEVASGEVLAIVGPNGAGKSTLLAVLARDLPVTAGEVTLLGAPLHHYRARELARRRAVLPQQQSYAFPFPVREVIEMGRAPWVGTPSARDDEAAVTAAVAHTEVGHLLDRPVSALSGGERARVGLARVLAQRAPVLLLDEPTAALDLRHQELVLHVARAEAARGAGVVVVLHDLALAAAHADRLALVAAGALSRVGPPREVLTAERLSAVYEHDVEVWPHPRTGDPLVLPRRDRPA